MEGEGGGRLESKGRREGRVVGWRWRREEQRFNFSYMYVDLCVPVCVCVCLCLHFFIRSSSPSLIVFFHAEYIPTDPLMLYPFRRRRRRMRW